MSEPLPPVGAMPPGANQIVYPAWMDGRYVTAASRVIISNPVPVLVGTTPVIPARAERWALGILGVPVVGSSFRFGPDPRPDLYPLNLTGSDYPRWITIFEFGPIVTGELYLWDSAGSTIKYVEVCV